MPPYRDHVLTERCNKEYTSIGVQEGIERARSPVIKSSFHEHGVEDQLLFGLVCISTSRLNSDMANITKSSKK
jgi:hypothetical protein